MNRYDELQTMTSYEIVEEIMKISASSTWKCRLCVFKDNCNKSCYVGIRRFFTDEKGSENK